MPASKGRVPAEGLEHPEDAAVAMTNGRASKNLFIEVTRRLCQLPV
jgi:hypothetical protein